MPKCDCGGAYEARIHMVPALYANEREKIYVYIYELGGKSIDAMKRPLNLGIAIKSLERFEEIEIDLNTGGSQ